MISFQASLIKIHAEVQFKLNFHLSENFRKITTASSLVYSLASSLKYGCEMIPSSPTRYNVLHCLKRDSIYEKMNFKFIQSKMTS